MAEVANACHSPWLISTFISCGKITFVIQHAANQVNSHKIGAGPSLKHVLRHSPRNGKNASSKRRTIFAQRGACQLLIGAIFWVLFNAASFDLQPTPSVMPSPQKNQIGIRLNVFSEHSKQII